MGRHTLPPEKKIQDAAIKLRGTAAENAVWREIAALLGLRPTHLARDSQNAVMQILEHHMPELMARAVKRANRALIEDGHSPTTVEAFLADLDIGPLGPLIELLAETGPVLIPHHRKRG